MVKQVTLNVQVRDGLGKEKAKKLRREGLVPAVFYGKGIENINLLFNEKEFIKGVKGTEARLNAIFNLKIKNGDAIKEELAYIPDSQFDPIKGNVVHVDFMKINEKEPISTRVPVKIIGDCPAIKAGFVLAQPIHELPIRCLPLEIPICIEIDVSVLAEAHDAIKVGDIKLKGITIELPAEQQIIHAEVPREMKVADETQPEEFSAEVPATAQKAEGEAAPKTEGEAPAKKAG